MNRSIFTAPAGGWPRFAQPGDGGRTGRVMSP